MNKNIMALDASTKRTGYAIYSSETKDIKYGVISASSTKVENRLIIMRDEISKLIKENNIDLIIIEDVRPDSGNARTGKVLIWLQGVLAVAAYEANKKIEFIMILPSSWRKVLKIKQGRGVRREEQKQIDIAFVNSNYNLNLSPSQDDEADAICILKAYLINSNIMIEETSSRRNAPIGTEESVF